MGNSEKEILRVPVSSEDIKKSYGGISRVYAIIEGIVELCEGDARSMPYQDNQFHAVYMASTLELFDTPDIPTVLKEVKRVLKPNGRFGVASLTKEGRESSLFLKFYEWLHQKMSKYANCRPIYVEESVAEAGYQITKAEEFILFKIVPWKIVVARPLVD